MKEVPKKKSRSRLIGPKRKRRRPKTLRPRGTHCSRGHPFDKAVSTTGHQYCTQCHRDNWVRYQARQTYVPPFYEQERAGLSEAEGAP